MVQVAKGTRVLVQSVNSAARNPHPAQPEQAGGELVPDSGSQLLTVGQGTSRQSSWPACSTKSAWRPLSTCAASPVVAVTRSSVVRSSRCGCLTAGIRSRWEPEPELGGFRRPVAGSPNPALRHPSFRRYADYMETDVFARALDRLLDEASRLVVAAMYAETLWWRCHRSRIADAGGAAPRGGGLPPRPRRPALRASAARRGARRAAAPHLRRRTDSPHTRR